MMPLDSDFQCFKLTPEECKDAQTYTPVQRAFLQNLLGEKAHVKINLKVTPNDINGFIQEEAFLTGQIELLRLLLSPVMPTTQNSEES